MKFLGDKLEKGPWRSTLLTISSSSQIQTFWVGYFSWTQWDEIGGKLAPKQLWATASLLYARRPLFTFHLSARPLLSSEHLGIEILAWLPLCNSLRWARLASSSSAPVFHFCLMLSLKQIHSPASACRPYHPLTLWSPLAFTLVSVTIALNIILIITINITAVIISALVRQRNGGNGGYGTARGVWPSSLDRYAVLHSAPYWTRLFWGPVQRVQLYGCRATPGLCAWFAFGAMHSKECYIIFYVIAVASIIKQNINVQDPSKVCTKEFWNCRSSISKHRQVDHHNSRQCRALVLSR